MALSSPSPHTENMVFGSGYGSKFVARLRKKLSRAKEETRSDAVNPISQNNNNTGNGPRNIVPLRPGQVTRKESERRDRLREHELTPEERRSKRRSLNPRNTSASLQIIPSMSDGNLNEDERRRSYVDPKSLLPPQTPASPVSPASLEYRPLPLEPASPVSPPQEQRIEDEHRDSITNNPVTPVATQDSTPVQPQPPAEPQNAGQDVDVDVEWRWILNLSMHFRDHSDREKFFVTYAETPKVRRRITVSCDYRNAPLGSLEKELSMMKYQRDKSAKIYEAIKESLPDIQFYDTITNLKLQTSEGRLHVHVTEDYHEIINFPSVHSIAHLDCPRIRERDLDFECHLSGFVYKVKHGEQVYIKKEIPGPDTIDEFLYEINALNALKTSNHVIRFGGCVVDDSMERVKGLLIAFASKGALIDIVYNEKGQLPWAIREKWAKQIVAGLSDIHEAGYVQGDFTLSNIVVDEDDNAKIIDINRRGCPVGWEPPEITGMIEGLQRIGMYIGVKSDIFQLGMCLWGLAHEHDEPEIEPRPLSMRNAPWDVPHWFQELVDACLSRRPQDRPSAKELLAKFPSQTSSQHVAFPPSPNIVEVVAPFDDDDLRNSPLPEQSNVNYMQINGVVHAVPVPPIGLIPIPTYCISNPDENFEKAGAGIESSASIKDEVIAPLDEVVDEIASDMESENGRATSRPVSRSASRCSSRPTSRGSLLTRLDTTNLALGPRLNGKGKMNGNSSGIGSQPGSHRQHVDSGFADFEGHLRQRQHLHPHSAIKT